MALEKNQIKDVKCLENVSREMQEGRDMGTYV